MVHTWCVFVADIHLSRSWMSGSFQSVRWNPCEHRLVLGLYSHLKEFWGNGVRTHVNSKGKIPSTGKILPRGVSNPWRCIKQESELKTLPTSYSSHALWLISSRMPHTTAQEFKRFEPALCLQTPQRKRTCTLALITGVLLGKQTC